MKKIRVGIVGFGNVGKEIAKQLEANKDFELIAIFSRRKISGCVEFEKLKGYIDKIDILFLCVGSQSDLEHVAFETIKNFNTIDCYDNHNRLKDYISKMDILAKQNKRVALSAMGWDPGLFSLIRTLFAGLNFEPFTFWGKGLSQGHTQAIKALPNVLDAIQFTIPNQKAKQQIKDVGCWTDTKSMHKRLCYVVCDKQFQTEVKRQIKTMPDYFLGYDTTVKFVTQQELDSLKSFAHKGEVVTEFDTIKFELDLKSNHAFTAHVMICYAFVLFDLIYEKQFGAKTCLDIPVSKLVDDKYKYL